jgi:hypothetical protein
MNRVILTTLLGLTMVVGGCGASSTNSITSTNSNNINGNWTATLTNTDSTQPLPSRLASIR